MSIRARLPHRVLALGAALFVASCGGGGDDSGDTSADGGDVGDGDATLEFVDAELVWALDGEPVGDELSYAAPIERDRFEAGIRWEVRFEAVGDIGDIDAELFRRISVNDDLIESGRAGVGPERGRFYVDDPFSVTVRGGMVIASLHVDRPVSASTLDEERRRFEEFVGVDADAEQIDVGDDMVVNIDRLVDLPPAGAGGVNRYEYTARGEIVIGNGSVVEVNDSIVLLVRDARSVDELDLDAPCAELAAQYVEQFEPQFEQPEMVLLDRLQAADMLSRAAVDAECGPSAYAVPACAAATALVTESGGDPSAAPWSEAIEVCPDGAAAVDATVLPAEFDEGTLRLVVPTTRDGLPALEVVIAMPEWTFAPSPPLANGQQVEFDWPGADGFREAWIEVATAAVPTDLMEERFEAGVGDATVTGLVVDRQAGAVDGRRWEWAVATQGRRYEFAAARVLDDERLLTIRGAVTDDDGRAPTDENVTELIRCIVDSIVVRDWAFDADSIAAGRDCRSTGSFVPAGDSGPTTTGPDAETDAEIETDPDGEAGSEGADDVADEAVDGDGDGDVVDGNDPPSAEPAVADVDLTPIIIDEEVEIPVAPLGDAPGGSVYAVMPFGWQLTEFDASSTRSVVVFTEPESGATAQFAIAVGDVAGSDPLLEPIGNGEILDETTSDWFDQPARRARSQWEALSGGSQEQSAFVAQFDDARVVSFRVIAPTDSGLDPDEVLDQILEFTIPFVL